MNKTIMSADTTSSPAPSTQDALAVLRADHRRADALFADYARLIGGPASAADRSAMISRIGALLRAHSQIEAELFYPALGDDGSDIDHAQADHDRMLSELERLAARAPGGAGVDGQVAQLSKAFKAHAAFEESRLFPRAAGLDLAALGARLAVRRGELLGDQGYD